MAEVTTEHAPQCNDLCRGDEHFLLGDGARLEYGVILDRTSQGLGYYLASTHATRERAERTTARGQLSGFPAEVKVRCVHYGEWTNLPTTTADPERAALAEGSDA